MRFYWRSSEGHQDWALAWSEACWGTMSEVLLEVVRRSSGLGVGLERGVLGDNE